MRRPELLFLRDLHAVISLLMSLALITARAAKNCVPFCQSFYTVSIPRPVFLLAWPGVLLMVAKAAPESDSWEHPGLYTSHLTPDC